MVSWFRGVVRVCAVAAVAAGALMPIAAQVTSSRLATQATADGNWLIYSGAYTSQRFSPLDQISSSNVIRLKPLWVYQPPGVGSIEGTPVVADGVIRHVGAGQRRGVCGAGGRS
jgi:glucose dehydrogenase